MHTSFGWIEYMRVCNERAVNSVQQFELVFKKSWVKGTVAQDYCKN